MSKRARERSGSWASAIERKRKKGKRAPQRVVVDTRRVSRVSTLNGKQLTALADGRTSFGRFVCSDCPPSVWSSGKPTTALVGEDWRNHANEHLLRGDQPAQLLRELIHNTTDKSQRRARAAWRQRMNPNGGISCTPVTPVRFGRFHEPRRG